MCEQYVGIFAESYQTPNNASRRKLVRFIFEEMKGELLLCRDQRLTLACVLDKDSNRALQQLLSVSNTCSGQVLDFSNTSSRPLSLPSALFDWYLRAQKPPNSAKLSISELKCA